MRRAEKDHPGTGAGLVLTPLEESIGGAVKRAEELFAEIGSCFIPQQFTNPDNPNIHYQTTAVEPYD